MDNRPIGIFDSGIGGLTVFSEVKSRLINEDLIYLGDTANFPYGPRPKEEIINLTKKNVEFLILKNCKMIVIACGTATSQALDRVKDRYNVPIIGIIEPTVEEILKDENETIGIIATEGTIRANSWEIAIKERNKSVNVINKACPLLARMAEEDFETEEVQVALKKYLEPFKNIRVDKLILGCTHYPIFRELIEQELENNVEIISTSEGVCEYIRELMNKKDAENTKEHMGEYKIFLSKKSYNFTNISKRLFNIDESKVYLADIK